MLIKRKKKGTVDTHIRICDTIKEAEINPIFKGTVQKHRDILILAPFHNENTIVASTNQLIEQGKQIHKKKQKLEQDCKQGDGVACAEIEDVLCVHCDDVDMMLHDLQEDKSFLQCFDDVFGSQKDRKQERPDLRFNTNKMLIGDIVQSNRQRNQARAQLFQKGEQDIQSWLSSKGKPVARNIAFDQLRKALTKNKRKK